MQLLIIDDDFVFRERLQKALTRRGYLVSGVSDAVEARTIFERQSSELNSFNENHDSSTGQLDSELNSPQIRKVTHALLDLSMPGEDGLSLLRFIRAIAPEVVCVVLTGYGSIATALEAVRIGAIDYLTKPCDAERILGALLSSNRDEFQAPEFRTVESIHDGTLAASFPTASFPIANFPTPSLSQVEWDHIQRVLHDCDGNVTQAAKLLGMHRRSLQRKLAKSPGVMV